MLGRIRGYSKAAKVLKDNRKLRELVILKNGLTDEFLVTSTEKSLNHWYQDQT